MVKTPVTLYNGTFHFLSKPPLPPPPPLPPNKNFVSSSEKISISISFPGSLSYPLRDPGWVKVGSGHVSPRIWEITNKRFGGGANKCEICLYKTYTLRSVETMYLTTGGPDAACVNLLIFTWTKWNESSQLP